MINLFSLNIYSRLVDCLHRNEPGPTGGDLQGSGSDLQGTGGHVKGGRGDLESAGGFRGRHE